MKRAILTGAAIATATALCAAQAAGLSATQASAAPVKRPVRTVGGLGLVAHPMILGGLPAASGTFGMMAFVSYEDPGGGSGFVCSGTVISPQLVLTAGHCAEDPDTGVLDQPGGYAVVTGSLDWTSPSRQVSGVSRTIIDPVYNRATGDGDAALLVLSTPTSAPAVALAGGANDASLVQGGTPAEIAGWGLTATGTLPTQLQWGVSVVQSPTDCAADALSGNFPFDAGRQTCAVDTPTYADGTCNGDSGGPLLTTRPDGTWVEIGVTSFGATNCYTGLPDFFTRADSISPWAGIWMRALSASSGPSGPVDLPPPPAAAPPTASAARKPLSGVYRGQTSQHRPITVRVNGARNALSSLSFSFRLSCTRHRPVSYSVSPGRGHITWRLRESRGMGFDDTFTDTAGEHYEVKGNFDSSGSVGGFLTTTWRSRRFGTCRSGLVSWAAHNV